MAVAEATGQSLLVKNSSHSVWPIISELEPASRSGITNSPTIGMKQSSTPAPTPGSDSGNVTSQNTCARRGAEIGGGLLQRRLHLRQRRIERQDHERQIGIDDAEIHRAVGRQPHHRRRDQMQRQQDLVEQAVMLQDVDPGIDADQERGPERHDHQHHRDAPASASAAAPCHRRWDSRSASRIEVETAATTRLRR